MKIKKTIGSLIFIILMIVVIVHFGTDLFTRNDSTEETQTTYQRAKKRRNPNFKLIDLGMSQKQVTKILGTPDQQTATELTYNGFKLDFTDNKLTDGTPEVIAHAAKLKRKQARLANENKDFNNKQKLLKLNAMEFGQKDLQTVQNFTGSMYTAVNLGDSTAYAWKTGNGDLIRIDKPQYNYVGVYTYDRGNIGTELYSGHTILQQSPRQGTLYGNQ